MKWKPPKARSGAPGPRTQSNRAARTKVWAKVLLREHYKCAGCGSGGRTLVWAHVMGRPGSGATLGKWANSEELTTCLCANDPASGHEGCHERYDSHQDLDLAARILSDAITRLTGRGALVPDIPAGLSPGERVAYWKSTIRAQVRWLEENGLEP